MVSLDLSVRDEHGKRVVAIPGILSREAAHKAVDGVFDLAEKSTAAKAAHDALLALAKPTPKRREGPAYTALAYAKRSPDEDGWYLEARSGKERYCVSKPGHDARGPQAGHAFLEPAPERTKVV